MILRCVPGKPNPRNKAPTSQRMVTTARSAQCRGQFNASGWLRIVRNGIGRNPGSCRQVGLARLDRKHGPGLVSNLPGLLRRSLGQLEPFSPSIFARAISMADVPRHDGMAAGREASRFAMQPVTPGPNAGGSAMVRASARGSPVMTGNSPYLFADIARLRRRPGVFVLLCSRPRHLRLRHGTPSLPPFVRTRCLPSIIHDESNHGRDRRGRRANRFGFSIQRLATPRAMWLA